MQLSNNTIVITGGGSGIGRELTRQFHALDNTVIVAGRNLENLNETIAGLDNTFAYELDVSSPESIDSFTKTLLEKHPNVNVLINNAGIMGFEDLATKRDLAHAEEIMTVNVLGVMRMTNALVDQLCVAENAVLMNVSSGLAFVPLPAAATYSASKAAVHSYTQSLRRHLENKVEVIEIAPPAVRTELNPGQSKIEEYMPLDEFIEETMSIIKQQPTPEEILVERVMPLRNAEKDEKVDVILQAMPTTWSN